MKHLLRTSSAIIIATSLFTHANAQTIEDNATTKGDEQTLNQPALMEDDIVVVGSRLKSGARSEPVLVIDSTDIELRGIVSVDQLLRQVTVNTPSISSSNPGGVNGARPINRGTPVLNKSGGSVANLRGLGAGSTLVLVNGRRLAGEGANNGDFADISGIPVEAIERVEVLTAGASAIYGADAVAGVINIVLKKDYVGSKLAVRTENSSSGADLNRINGTIGKGWDTGNLTVSASWQEQKSVNATEFGFTTADFRGRGGFDLRRFVSPQGAFIVNNFDRQFLDPDSIFIDNALVLPDGFGGVDALTDTSLFNTVPLNQLDELIRESLTPEETTYGLSARLSQEVNLSFVNEFFVDVLYSNRETVTETQAPSIDIFGPNIVFGDFGSPFFDPDPFGLDFTRDLSAEVAAGIIPNNGFDTKGEDYSVAFGFDGDFSSTWSWDVNASFAKNKDTVKDVEFSAQSAYSGFRDPNTFDLIIDPFNLVRSDFLTNADAATALRNSLISVNTDSKTDLKTYQGIIKGELFDGRDAGGLELAFGVQRRDEDTTSESLLVNVATSEPERFAIDAKRTVNALFAEFSFPVIERLSINGALRYEEVQNKGATVSVEQALAAFNLTGEDQFTAISDRTNFDESVSGISPRLGVAFDPVDWLTLRGTMGKSFRAPNVQELGEPALAEAAFAFGVIDPQTGEEVDPFTPSIAVGNLALKEETASTYNIGFTATPPLFGDSVELKVEYFGIDYKDRIGRSNTFLAIAGLRDIEERDVVRDASGDILYFLDRPVNTFEESLTGIDATLTHDGEISGIDIFSSLSVSQTLTSEKQESIDAPLEDRLGIGQPKTRLNASTTLSKGRISATAVARYTGGYELDLGEFSPLPRDIESFTTIDLQGAYRFSNAEGLMSGVAIKAGATNLFNNDGPQIARGIGVDTSSFDLRKRVLYLEVSKNF